MDNTGKVILGMYGLVFVCILGIIVYLIFRRIRLRKQEDFEKRDN